MLKRMFSDSSRTGIYTLSGGKLTELPDTPGNGSINSIGESLGFAPNQIHTVHCFHSKRIECLGFKIFSKEVIFALAKENKRLSLRDILDEKNRIDWRFEYSSLDVEDILDRGIQCENLTLGFLNSVLDLSDEEKNLYKSERLGLYLRFEDNFLSAYSSSEWENSSSKWLKEVNETMFNEMIKEARSIHQNEIDTMEEVNRQASSLLNIPDAMTNQFIDLHIKANGNINFFNLLVAHYTQECEVSEFLFINKGRTEQLNEFEYGVGTFVYEFNDVGKLVGVYER